MGAYISVDFEKNRCNFREGEINEGVAQSAHSSFLHQNRSKNLVRHKAVFGRLKHFSFVIESRSKQYVSIQLFSNV